MSKDVCQRATNSAVVVLRTARSKIFTTGVPDAVVNPLRTAAGSIHEALRLDLQGYDFVALAAAGRFGSFASGNFTDLPVHADW